MPRAWGNSSQHFRRWSAIALTGGFSSLNFGGLGWIVLFIVLAPALGYFLGPAIAIAVMWTCRRLSYSRVDRLFRWGQLVSAALFSACSGTPAARSSGV